MAYLNLDGVETPNLEMAAGVLPSYFRVKYGFDDIRRMEWSRSRLKYSPYLVSNRVRMECPNGNYAKGPQIREAFEQRVEESTSQELFEVCQSLASRLSKDGSEGQTIYYRQMVKGYHDIRQDAVKRGKAGEVLNAKILPHLAGNEGNLTAAVIRSILSEDDFRALDRAFIHIRSISTTDIAGFNVKLQEHDRLRNVMHQDLVAFAAEFMGKNDLQVIFDVLAEEGLEKGHLSLKGDNLYYIAGVTSIKMGPRMVEFMVGWPNAEAYYAKQIKATYQYLRKIRRGDFGYGYLRYESDLGKDRQEVEDVAFFKPLLKQYPAYLKWEDGLIGYFHGDYTFSKRICIDLKRIKEEHADSAGFTEGILDRIREMVDNKRILFNEV